MPCHCTDRARYSNPSAGIINRNTGVGHELVYSVSLGFCVSVGNSMKLDYSTSAVLVSIFFHRDVITQYAIHPPGSDLHPSISDENNQNSRQPPMVKRVTGVD